MSRDVWKSQDRPCPPCSDCGADLYEQSWGYGGWPRADKATDELHTQARCIANLKAALHWEDAKDEWTERIRAAHPSRSGSHDTYATAMRMVGNRHSKGELVALVNWLLLTGQR
jgi:hypothetical protein